MLTRVGYIRLGGSSKRINLPCAKGTPLVRARLRALELCTAVGMGSDAFGFSVHGAIDLVTSIAPVVSAYVVGGAFAIDVFIIGEVCTGTADRRLQSHA